MENVRSRLIHLHRCRHLTRRRILYLWKQDKTLQTVYQHTPSTLSTHLKLTPQQANNLHNDLHDTRMIQQIKMDLQKYETVTIVDEHFPVVLNTIKDPPLVLYAVGDLKLLTNRKTLSVIGSRKMSREAKWKVEQIVTPLIQEDWLIVSGMALGIDTLAHETTLAHKGKTIAVLGGGFENIYPKQNHSLYQRIKQNGLLLSEYPPQTPPARYRFPERNRLISGLSFGTLVIEATEKSGTLITVGQALDQGREVYAVPGSPRHQQSTGCFQLIQDGAKLVYRAEDITEDWDQFGKYFHCK